MKHLELVLAHDAELEAQQEKLTALILQHHEEIARLLNVLPEIHRDALAKVLPEVNERLEHTIPELVAAEVAEARGELSGEQKKWAEDAAARLDVIRAELFAQAKQDAGTLAGITRELGAVSEAQILETLTAAVDRMTREQFSALDMENKVRAMLAAVPTPQPASFIDLYQGQYKPGTQARRGEIWTYVGNTFLCIADTTQEPRVRPGVGVVGGWELLAAAGATGADGTGGSGASLPDQTGHDGEFLKTDGSAVSWEAIPGGGDMLASNNLSDVADNTVAFANIKQDATNAASGVVVLADSNDNTAGKVVQGSDARLALAVAAEPGNANIQIHIARTDNPHAVTLAQVGAEAANANIQLHIASTSNPHAVTAAQAGAEAANANIQLHIASTSNPHGVTKAQVGLTNVTDNVQTNASILPNTAPAAGRVPVGNAGGTAYAPVAISGDATLDNVGALTIASNVVSNAKLLVMAANTFKGRKTQSTGAPEDISILELQQLCNPLPISPYTLTAVNVGENDAGKLCTLNNASAGVITVLLDNAYTTAHSNGASILYLQSGAGVYTFTPQTSGINVCSRGQALKTAGLGAMATLVKLSPNQWYLSGDITA